MTRKDFIIEAVADKVKTSAGEGIIYSGVFGLAAGVFGLAFSPDVPVQAAAFGVIFGFVFGTGILIDWSFKFDQRAKITNALIELIRAEIASISPITQSVNEALVERADEPNRQVNVAVPPQEFLEWAYALPKTPTEAEARSRFPGQPTGEWFESMARTGHLQGRSNHGRGGIRVGTIEEALKHYGFSAKTATANGKDE